MTIDNKKSVTIPVWLISIIMAVTTAGFTAWGIVSVVKTKTIRNETDIEILRKEKISRDEFNLVLFKLNILERKIDEINENR